MNKKSKTTNRLATNRLNGNGARETITIERPNLQFVTLGIRGNAPYVQNQFSQKARETMRGAQEAGSTGKKGKKKEAKDFHQCFLDSIHRATDGWAGIPAGAFRNALVSACRVCGFQMTKAKLAVFVEADGFDKVDGTPLVRITKGEPEYCEHFVRIQQTTDLRARAMWHPGWEAQVTVRFDADMFTEVDILNLFMRVGLQVGIGEGRPDSKSGTGMGWGTFDIISE